MEPQRTQRNEGVDHSQDVTIRCLTCRCEMEVRRLQDDEHRIEYSGYQCPGCGHIVVTLDQMRAYQATLDLKRAIPVRRKIVRIGSSLGFTLPSSVRQAGLSQGQEIEITVLDARHLQIELLDRGESPGSDRKAASGKRVGRSRRAA